MSTNDTSRTARTALVRPTRVTAALAAAAIAVGAGTVAIVVPATAQAASTTATAPTCPVTPQNALLKRGDRGPDVAAVQCLLGVASDGVYGPRTEAAVKDFQRGNRLTVDGVAGPRTIAALATAATIDSPAAETRAAVAAGPLLRQGSRGPAVVVLQTALGVTADGVFGPRTETAVRSVQLKAGVATDGIVGPQTREALAAGAVAH